MRVLLAVFVVVALLGCSQADLLQKFAPPEAQAAAQSYIDQLRAGKFDEIEKAIDPAIRIPNVRETLTKMAALFPGGKPTSMKLVGAQTFQSSDAKTINLTFEYGFGDKWLLANVAVRERAGTRAIIGFNVNPIPKSLEALHKFTLSGKGFLHYAVLVGSIAAALVSLYAFILCLQTKLPRRKWLWLCFILVGFGKLAINWTTGEWAITPLAFQLFSTSAFAQLYGPWMIALSLPVGAIAFLFYRKSRLPQKPDPATPKTG